jgi:hypothetical protein
MEDWKMKNTEFMRICKHYTITSISEGVDYLLFARDILEAEADHTEKTEPYATNTIKRLRDSAREIDTMANDIDSMMP